LEKRNYLAVLQKEKQQERMQKLQRHHPTVGIWKVFALVQLNGVMDKLLSKRHHEQSGFTPVDRI